MIVKYYTPLDYFKLIELYKLSDQFEIDQITDSQELINRKVERDPESILIVEHEGTYLGSVSIVEDGRIALLFRLVVHPQVNQKEDVLKMMIGKVEEILKQRGFVEAHNPVPLENQTAHQERIDLGFQQGKNYSWFWKKLA